LAFAGSLSFNPLTDSLTDASGKPFKFKAPFGDELPKRSFDTGVNTYQAPPKNRANVCLFPAFFALCFLCCVFRCTSDRSAVFVVVLWCGVNS
jgi:hypothetical protein